MITRQAYNFRFGIGEKVDFFNTYTIQIWNKPKEAGNGNPDMVFVNGKTDEGLAGDGMCSREIYTFPQTHSESTLEIFHSDSECQVEEHPVNAVGELIVGEGTAKGAGGFIPNNMQFT